MAVTGASTTSYQAIALTTGITYEFRVVAINDVGESIPSTSTPMVIATVPGEPSSPSKIDQTLTTLKIQWIAPTIDGGSPVTDYQIKIDREDGNGFVVSGNTGSASILQFTQTGLTPGQDYHFTVAAINIVGQGVDSIATKIVAGTVPA
jgi:predicted phage tail protein